MLTQSLSGLPAFLSYFATAIGLFAAIPAVIAYNKFSNALDKFAGKLENFSVEFNTLLSRQIEG